MTVADQYPCLIISLSDSMENSRVVITTPELHLCRLATATHGDCGVDLDLMTIHRSRHACITRQRDTFILTNLGERSLRIYEKELVTGMAQELRHGDVFLIPDPDTLPPDGLHAYYVIMFLSDPDQTARATFYLNEQLRRVYIFGADIRLAPKEYDIIRYLYLNRPEPRTRHEIIAAVWPETRSDPALIALQEEPLHAHLTNIRRKIRKATEERFTFLEHIRGKGIRLLV